MKPNKANFKVILFLLIDFRVLVEILTKPVAFINLYFLCIILVIQ